MTSIEIEDNGKKGRFLIREDGGVAGEMTFVWAGDKHIIIEHTNVDEKHGGKGFGKKLLNQAVQFARRKNLKITPLCPFAKKMFDRDEGIADVLA